MIDKIEKLSENSKNQMPITPHTRESLLAEWDEINPSEPMPTELQTLCMMFANTTAASRAAHIQRPCLIQSPAPPPQRFQRRRSGTISRVLAPPGPYAVHPTKHSALSASIFSSLPLGPEEECECGRADDMDLAFEAINELNRPLL